MRIVKFKQHKLRALMAVFLIVLLVVAVWSIYRLFIYDPSVDSTNSKIKVSDEITYTSETKIKEAEKRNGIPFGRGSISASNLSYYWSNETVVDGDYYCYVFNEKTYQIYGSTYTTAGFGSPSVSGRNYYQNQDYDIDSIDQTIDSVCNRKF